MQLTPRQGRIVEQVKHCAPITAEDLAAKLSVSRAAIRADLALLTMSGYLAARPRVGYTYAGRQESAELLARLCQLKVRDVQAIPTIIRATSSLYDAVVATFVEDASTLFVLDDAEHLLGAVSRSDLLRSAIGQVDLDKVPVSVIMTRACNLATLQPDDHIFAAARKFRTHGLSVLPIVKEVATASGQGLEVTGIISLNTVNALLIELMDMC